MKLTRIRSPFVRDSTQGSIDSVRKCKNYVPLFEGKQVINFFNKLSCMRAFQIIVNLMPLLQIEFNPLRSRHPYFG
jgi:hypothetical protein